MFHLMAENYVAASHRATDDDTIRVFPRALPIFISSA